MHGSGIERLTAMGFGADVPLVAHFPSNRWFPQRNRHLPYQGPSVWNSIDEDIKLSSLSLFKKKMKQHFIKDY